MNKFIYKLADFMQGRYGIDELYKFLFIIFWIIAIISIVIRNPIIYLLEMLICVYMMFRALSRNIYKRQNENAKYLKIKNKVIEKIKLHKKKWADKKTQIKIKLHNLKPNIK